MFLVLTLWRWYFSSGFSQAPQGRGKKSSLPLQTLTSFLSWIMISPLWAGRVPARRNLSSGVIGTDTWWLRTMLDSHRWQFRACAQWTGRSRLTSHLYAHAESSKNIDIHIAFWMIRDYRTMFKIFNQQSFRCQAKHLVFPSNKNQILKIHLERIGLFLKKKKNWGGGLLKAYVNFSTTDTWRQIKSWVRKWER